MKKTYLILLIVAMFLLGAGSEHFFDITSGVMSTKQTVDFNLKGDLLFNADNTYDIGTSTVSPKIVYANDVTLDDDLTVGDNISASDLTANTIMWGDTSTSAVGSDSFAVSITPAPSALTTGMSLYFKPDTANTGACVLNVNSLGWKSIKTASGADPANNDLVTTTVGHLIYDGTNFLLMNPATTTD